MSRTVLDNIKNISLCQTSNLYFFGQLKLNQTNNIKIMVNSCNVCELLKKSTDFTGTHCVSCGQKLRDEDIEAVSRTEVYLDKIPQWSSSKQTRSKNISNDDIYKKCYEENSYNNMNIDICLFACDVYCVNPYHDIRTIPRVYMYTAREILAKYNITMKELELIRKKIPRNVENKGSDTFKHTFYRLFETKELNNYQDVTCSDTVAEYNRFKEYAAIYLNKED